jgi:hypothetical protein
MRTPGSAAITMVLAIAACSDVAAPPASTFETSSLEASYQWDRDLKFGAKHDECRDDDHGHAWGRHRHSLRFRHWGWRLARGQAHFRGHDDDCPPEPGPATGSISGTVLNEGAAAVGYSVFLLNADGSVAATVATDAAGAYTFGAAAAGTYLVCEENPFTEENGFLGETRPATGEACPGEAYAPRGFSLVLAAGAALTENNFSNMRLD